MRRRLGTALALSLLLLPASAGAQAPTVQPGDQAMYPDQPPGPAPGGCTLGWLFDGSDGRAYFSIAAHCGGRGNPVETAAGEPIGTVSLAGEDGGDAGLDVALIRVSEAMESRVAGTLRGHEDMPSGVISPLEAAAGDAVQISGWGIGFNNAEATREQRVGVFLMGDEWSWRALAPTINGDSGGPVAHVATGKALGLQKGHGCYASPYEAAAACGTYGPSIAAIERLAGKSGLKLTLRLAGQPAPPKPAAPADPPVPPAPATQPAPPPAKKKPSAKAACQKKAKKIKNKRKRRAALKRCAKKR